MLETVRKYIDAVCSGNIEEMEILYKEMKSKEKNL